MNPWQADHNISWCHNLSSKFQTQAEIINILSVPIGVVGSLAPSRPPHKIVDPASHWVPSRHTSCSQEKRPAFTTVFHGERESIHSLGMPNMYIICIYIYVYRYIVIYIHYLQILE